MFFLTDKNTDETVTTQQLLLHIYVNITVTGITVDDMQLCQKIKTTQ